MKLLVVTYLDKIDRTSKRLRDSAKKYKIDLEICGINMKYKMYNNIKIKWMKSYFDQKGDQEKTIIIFMDGNDTEISKNFRDKKVIKYFERYDCDILLSTGSECKKSNGDYFFKYKMRIKKDRYWNFFNLRDNKCFNNGVIVGHYNKVRDYVNIMNDYYNRNDPKFKKLELKHKNSTGDQLLLLYLASKTKLLDHIKFNCDNKKKISYAYDSENNKLPKIQKLLIWHNQWFKSNLK